MRLVPGKSALIGISTSVSPVDMDYYELMVRVILYYLLMTSITATILWIRMPSEFQMMEAM